MNELDFREKRALVVGGSSGIGNGIAQALRSRGADVHVWGTRAQAGDYAGEKGSDLQGLHYTGVDITDYEALNACVPPFQDLDILVLCQGTVRYKRQEFEKPGWDAVMNVNLNSVMHTAMKFRGMLARSRGALVIISSTAGFTATRGNPAYSASKAGAVGLAKTLGEAWAPDGIRVNGVAPGLVDTKLTKVTTENKERLEMTLRNIPAGRLGTPEDIAGAVLFLASPLAAYVTGQTLIVDGGLTLS